MSISTALFSPPYPAFSPRSSSSSPASSFSNPGFVPKVPLSLIPWRPFSLASVPRVSAGNGSSPIPAATVEALKAPEAPARGEAEEVKESTGGDNGAPVNTDQETTVRKFEDPRWIGGTWDLKQFEKNGKTDWDAVIDAEANRRKWLEKNPESSSNDNPVLFDTSIIPWWAWIKRYHLPEAELLNGRAAMIGFFMAYLVDSLTGVGLVDQMGNFFCKTLLFVAVVGVLLIRKNEDVENLKKLIEETTFYDKQWQAAWKDENSTGYKNE